MLLLSFAISWPALSSQALSSYSPGKNGHSYFCDWVVTFLALLWNPEVATQRTFNRFVSFHKYFCKLIDILSFSYRFTSWLARPRLFKNLMSGDPSREFFRDSREFPFEFFVGQSSRRGLKFESTSANCGLPDFVYDDACLRLGLWFLN